jgi:hypothetical protein
MVKGYPMILSLQTKLGAESSINHRHIGQGNCGEIAGKSARCPDFVHLMLTMNSVARPRFPD